MPNRTIQEELSRVLAEARHAASLPDCYPYLPGIIRSLEAVQEALSLPKNRRNRMAGGIGRLVTENMEFAESPLGSRILKVADEFTTGG